MRSFIVDLGANFFDKLRWISFFEPLRKFFPSMKSYGGVEIWLLSNLLGSILCSLISSAENILWWEIVILIYAGIRVVEIVIYQINVVFFDEYRARSAGSEYHLESYRRIAILLLFNYFEILFWFALFYRNFESAFNGRKVHLNSFVGSLYYSLVTMSTLGYGDITPTKTFGKILIIIQTLIGVFMALVVIARFISFIPKPETAEESERKKRGRESRLRYAIKRVLIKSMQKHLFRPRFTRR